MPILPSKEKREIYARKIRGFWRDFSHNRIGLVGVGLILIYVIFGLFAPWMTPYPAIGAPKVAAAYAVPSWLTIFPQFHNLPSTIDIPLNWTPTQEYQSISVKYGGGVALDYNYTTGEIGQLQNYTFQVPFNYTYAKPKLFQAILNWEASFQNLSYRLEIRELTPNGSELLLFGEDLNASTLHEGVPDTYWNLTQISWLTTSDNTDLRLRAIYEYSYKKHFQEYYDEYMQPRYQDYYNSVMSIQKMLYQRSHDGSLEGFDSYWNGTDGYWNTTGLQQWEKAKPGYETDAYDYADPLAILKAGEDARLFSPTDVFFSGTGQYKILLRLIVEPLSEDASLRITFSGASRFTIWGSAWGLLGTDSFGEDVWSQLVYGARISLIVGILAALASTSLGIFFGVTSGYLGGVVDELSMRLVDILLCLPVLPILLALSEYYKPNVYFVVVLIAIFGWQGLSRVIRSRVLSLREMQFVESARASGASDSYLITRHLIPNIFPIAISSMILAVPGAILTEAAMSFLGFGDPFAPTWGKMLHTAQTEGAFQQLAWWFIIPPGLAITILCVAFVFVGHALDEIVNPRLRRRR